MDTPTGPHSGTLTLDGSPIQYANLKPIIDTVPATDFTIKGSGQQVGQPFEVAGTGVRSGTDFVAVDGRYLGGESRDSTAMTITLPIQAMTIPRKQVSRTTVSVLP